MSERNRTIRLSENDRSRLLPQLQKETFVPAGPNSWNHVVLGDVDRVLPNIPSASVDLVFADPPYNLDKTFGAQKARAMSLDSYERWVEGWIAELRRVLKPEGSIYVCGDWRSSTAIHRALERHFVVRNRITWEREKGRAALSNWKNASEDIWFATVGETFRFNLADVRVRRKVIAPYRDAGGHPKDWVERGTNGRYRDTAPSNVWTDLTVPFWSMAENTDHPTQKPEKLLAKVILASSCVGDVVLDPFLGSGTTTAVATKLRRRWLGIEREEEYALLALRRVELATTEPRIQGYEDKVFWERNSQPTSTNGGEKSDQLLLIERA